MHSLRVRNWRVRNQLVRSRRVRNQLVRNRRVRSRRVLIRRDREGALAIGQLSHAWLAGQLAGAWGNEYFGSVHPREEVVLGTQQHDIGWAQFDLTPRFNPATGLPCSFLELTVDEHLAIWSGAPQRLMSQSVYAALIVSLHGSRLSELRAQLAPQQATMLRPLIDEEHVRQAQLCAELGVSAAQRERVRRQVWAWDAISLALCSAWTPFTIDDVPTASDLTSIELRGREDGSSTLHPWPFGAERVEVQCEARMLAHSYPNEATMLQAFAQAVPHKLSFVLIAA